MFKKVLLLLCMFFTIFSTSVFAEHGKILLSDPVFDGLRQGVIDLHELDPGYGILVESDVDTKKHDEKAVSVGRTILPTKVTDKVASNNVAAAQASQASANPESGVRKKGFSAGDILPTTGEGTIGDASFDSSGGTNGGSTKPLDKLLGFVKDSIFGLLALVAIGMFLYVGFSLVKAQGNPEELKKAFMTLIHVIVGLFIIAVSWAVISMVSGFTF